MSIRKPDLRPAPVREQAGGPARTGMSSQRPAIDHGALKNSIGYLIHLADLANMQSFGRLFGDSGVTAARYTALELIGSNPGIKPAALAAAMAVERSNLVAIVRFLAQRDWVRTKAGPNRREKSLELTAAGELMLADLRVRLARHDRELSAKLSQADRDALVLLLGRIVRA